MDLNTIKTDFQNTFNQILPSEINSDDKQYMDLKGDPDCSCHGSGIRLSKHGKCIECPCVQRIMPEWQKYYRGLKSIKQQSRILESFPYTIGFANAEPILQETGNSEVYYRFLDYARTALRLGYWAILCGPSGLGKSILATCVTVYAYLHYGWQIQIYTVNKIGNIYDRLPDSLPYSIWDKSDEDSDDTTAELQCKSDWIELLENVPMLVIDDIGTEINKRYIPVIGDLITRRKENLNPTILTTNMTLEDFEADYKYRTNRRLLEMTDKEKYIMELEKLVTACAV